jgi:hypothetical protein
MSDERRSTVKFPAVKEITVSERPPRADEPVSSSAIPSSLSSIPS